MRCAIFRSGVPYADLDSPADRSGRQRADLVWGLGVRFNCTQGEFRVVYAGAYMSYGLKSLKGVIGE